MVGQKAVIWSLVHVAWAGSVIAYYNFQTTALLRPTVRDFRWVMIWHAFLDQTSGNRWQVCTKFRAKTPFQATFNTELQWLTTQSDRLKVCVWKKISPAFKVHSTDSASQLTESTVQLHRLLACVPRGWVLRPRALLNTEQRCVEGCWKLYETCCTQEIYDYSVGSTLIERSRVLRFSGVSTDHDGEKVALLLLESNYDAALSSLSSRRGKGGKRTGRRRWTANAFWRPVNVSDSATTTSPRSGANSFTTNNLNRLHHFRVLVNEPRSYNHVTTCATATRLPLVVLHVWRFLVSTTTRDGAAKWIKTIVLSCSFSSTSNRITALIGDSHDGQIDVCRLVAMVIWSWTSNVVNRGQNAPTGSTPTDTIAPRSRSSYRRGTFLLYWNEERIVVL